MCHVTICHVAICHVAMCHVTIQVRKLMQGHIDDMTDSRITIGEALESALELGEKHENFVTTCKEVERREGWREREGRGRAGERGYDIWEEERERKGCVIKSLMLNLNNIYWRCN